ncbi:exosortase-dependent surface protein XDP1 [Pseudomaricurvus sp.]|uniref:exosortase-dependent surface protein XDP1 n=1 Tax=Pseudomaricurvus sp. TaxID=2004510 RepID=UPI003F6B8F2B
MLRKKAKRNNQRSAHSQKFTLGCLTAFGLVVGSTGSLAAVDPAWDFTGPYATSSGSTTSNGMIFQSTNSSLTATVSGWADTSDDGRIENFNSELQDFGSSGLGLDRSSRNDGDHEIDNEGHQEFLVFNFSSPVSIAGYNFGWIDTDSDSTLLAYQGPDSDLGLTQSDGTEDLVSHGWTAIGHYLGGNNTYSMDTSGQTGGIYSSYWIIGSYLSDVTASSFNFNVNAGKDAFKLSSLNASTRPPDTPPPTGEAPAPASLGLLLGGLYLLQRRVKKQKRQINLISA